MKPPVMSSGERVAPAWRQADAPRAMRRGCGGGTGGAPSERSGAAHCGGVKEEAELGVSLCVCVCEGGSVVRGAAGEGT